MVCFRVKQDWSVKLTWEDLFQDYEERSTEKDFAEMFSETGTIISGEAMSNTPYLLGENYDLYIPDNAGDVLVTPLISCAAVAARCGQSSIYVYHASCGVVTEEAADKIFRMDNGGDTSVLQVIYVIPNADVRSYAESVNQMVTGKPDMQICVIAPESGKHIEAVQVNADGQLCIMLRDER